MTSAHLPPVRCCTIKQRQRAQRDADPEHERDQVGAEKFRPVRKSGREANGKQHGARKHQPQRQPFDFQRIFSAFVHFVWLVNFARSASGTSPIGTCRLSCSARM